MSGKKSRRRRASRRRWPVLAACVLVAVALASALLYYYHLPSGTTTSVSSQSSSSTGKYIILYVNQGNGMVDQSNLGSMLSFAQSHGFNTVFFQVYRNGSLLFQPIEMASFVSEAHAQGLKFFFALYLTNSSQPIPPTIYSLREDGISLDMSTLSLSAQTAIFNSVKQAFRTGPVAITTTDFALPIAPDLLVLETYGAQDQGYIRHGIVGSVGVFAASSRSDYEAQLQYALQNSDGVMVFDYAGLMKSGY